MTIDYRPIACDRHSEFELLAMRRAQVDAQIEGEMETLRVRVCDLVTKDRAEYLVVELSDGTERRWRLDHIVEMHPVVLERIE